MTQKPKLKLSFKYTLWSQSLSQLMTADDKFAFSILTIGNIAGFFIEVMVVVLAY